MKLKICALIIFSLITYLLLEGVNLHSEQFKLIFLEIRLPSVVAAIITGSLLAITGAMLQSFFNNQLIGPDILGISSGSSLSLAIYFYLGDIWIFTSSGLNASIFALIGALIVMLALGFFSKKLNGSQILVLGVLISYFSSSLISLLIFLSPALQVKNYFTWLNGSFNNLLLDQLVVFTVIGILLFCIMFIFPKKLELVALGEKTAISLGVNFKQLRMQMMVYISLCISFLIYFVGPISFIGIISSYVAIKFFGYQNMKQHLIHCSICGILISLLSLALAKMVPFIPSNSNILLGFISGPIILYMFSGKKNLYD